MNNEKLVKAKVQVLLDPHLAHVASTLIGLEWKEMPDGQTMATDGKYLMYSNDFVKNTPIEELQGVLVHEALHALLLHPFRLRGRNPSNR
jgi:predicted metal-dependent peptidase